MLKIKYDHFLNKDIQKLALDSDWRKPALCAYGESMFISISLSSRTTQLYQPSSPLSIYQKTDKL